MATGFWSSVWKFTQQAAKYAAVAFSGHEIGNAIEGDKIQVQRETTIIREQASEKSNVSIETILICVFTAVFVGILFACVQKLIKCLVKQEKSSNRNQDIEMQRPLPARRTESN